MSMALGEELWMVGEYWTLTRALAYLGEVMWMITLGHGQYLIQLFGTERCQLSHSHPYQTVVVVPGAEHLLGSFAVATGYTERH